MEKTSPTRMNLLSRKSQLVLASEGVELLKHKREALMSQFMELIKPLIEKRNQLHDKMLRAYYCLNTARSIDGWEGLDPAKHLQEQKVRVDIKKEVNWGVEIPKIDDIEGLDSQFKETYSPAITLRIFETKNYFKNVLKDILKLAPLEASLKRLGNEIRKTTRRINALEEMLMPKLRNEIRFIRSTLDEREREDNFRLRRIKNKKEHNK
ncbi:V-type ATP synthase subunit D [Candidatus Latescibacterota bacterium]